MDAIEFYVEALDTATREALRDAPLARFPR